MARLAKNKDALNKALRANLLKRKTQAKAMTAQDKAEVSAGDDELDGGETALSGPAV